MSEDLTKKAAEMLLKGATLLSEPCPYCKGVRVMKEGQALCISCGRKPEKKNIPKINAQEQSRSSLQETLEKKLETLSKELEIEKNHEKQQEIIKSINSLLETLEKMKNQQ
ncbi:MAG: Sjogren's syndrome/scleroderma autoantigen 1 family protein [Nitrosopumilus sp.]